MTVYVPHPDAPILVPYRNHGEPIRLRDHFRMVSASRLFSFARNAFRGDYDSFRVARATEAMTVSGVAYSRIQSTYYREDPGERISRDGEVTVPAGSLFLLADADNSKGEQGWYVMTPEQQKINHLQRSFPHGPVQWHDVSILGSTLGEWPADDARQAHVDDVNAMLELGMVEWPSDWCAQERGGSEAECIVLGFKKPMLPAPV